MSLKEIYECRGSRHCDLLNNLLEMLNAFQERSNTRNPHTSSNDDKSATNHRYWRSKNNFSYNNKKKKNAPTTTTAIIILFTITTTIHDWRASRFFLLSISSVSNDIPTNNFIFLIGIDAKWA